MNPDEDVCLCYHVSLRKLQTFMRREEPGVASQLSECLGAGTGCGWCRPFLEELHGLCVEGKDIDLDLSPTDYAKQRAAYREERKQQRARQSDDQTS